MILYNKQLTITDTVLTKAQVPKLFWSVQPKTVTDKGTREMMISLLKKMPTWLETGSGIIIRGNFMAGKTAFACMLLRQALSYSASGLFTYGCDVIRRGNKAVYGDRTLNDIARRVDLLVLDDLGAEDTGSDWAANTYELLIRARYENCLTTVVTTNLTIPELKARYRGAFLSVLKRSLQTNVVLKNTQFEGVLR